MVLVFILVVLGLASPVVGVFLLRRWIRRILRAPQAVAKIASAALAAAAPAPAQMKVMPEVPEGPTVPDFAKMAPAVVSGCVRGVPRAITDAEIGTALSEAAKRRTSHVRRTPRAAIATLQAGVGPLPNTVRIRDTSYDVTWLPRELELLHGFGGPEGCIDYELIINEIELTIIVKAKILLVFLQSMCYLPDIYYSVKWPKQFIRILRIFKVLNLDIFSARTARKRTIERTTTRRDRAQASSSSSAPTDP